MAGPSNHTHIDKLDFDNPKRPLLEPDQPDAGPSPGPSQVSHASSRSGSFFEQVAEGIQERDRERMKREIVRYGSFVVAVLSCLCCGSITAFSLYGHLFMTHLKYTQTAINFVSIGAEIAMYLPVPAMGYVCDRYGTRIPSLLAGALFGFGYLCAAFTYRSGPPVQLGGQGWPFWSMMVGFLSIGVGTSCMYMAAVSTCAKNFGRGKHKGVALAIPIAAFGLSGLWVSQVGSKVLYEKKPDGSKGDVDVFKFFVFLGIVLLAMGLLGSVALKVVDEEEMIDEAIEELEQSGLLDEGTLFQQAANRHGYGTINQSDLSTSQVALIRNEAELLKQREAEEQARKEWLLNAETRRFLSDRTMWWLAGGFFLVTGPGEAFFNNMGTVIGTLHPSSTPPELIPTTPATHVSIIALTSTISRIFAGTFTDLVAPTSVQHQSLRGPTSLSSSVATLESKRFSVSRVWFLLFFGVLQSVGQVILASGVIQNHSERLWIVTSFIGAGYGAVFSLTPILISVIWGVENFATNWGIVATVPAGGAAVWSIVYSAVYESGADHNPVYGDPERGALNSLCFGKMCYAPTFWAMAVSVWAACGLWVFAWRGPGGWHQRGVAV